MTTNPKLPSSQFNDFIKNHWIEIIGFIVFICGLILVLLFCEEKNWCEIGKYLMPIGIAIIASGIAISSDEKMKSIATGDFFDLANKFWDEDRAPKLYYEKIKEARDTQSWQLGNLFRHAEKLKKWAEPDVQERLIREFKTFLERLRSSPCEKYWVEVKNYMTTCGIAIDFNTKDDNMKNELIEELSNWLGKKKKEESNKEYLDRKGVEFSNKKDYDLFSIVE